MHFKLTYFVNTFTFQCNHCCIQDISSICLHLPTIMLENCVNVSFLLGLNGPESDNPAVITCSHGYEIEASALSVSAPQADKLMGRKGH